MIKTLIICLLFTGFYSQAQKIIPIDTSNVTTLRIDVGNAFGASASEVFESSTYIPLETTKESLFGKIDQLEITDDYFIILDETTNCILFFTKNGKFHHKIYGGGKHRMGNREEIRSFKLNRWKNEIAFVQIINGKWMHLVFDLKGTKKAEIVVKDEEMLNESRFITESIAISPFLYEDDKADRVKTRFLVNYVTNYTNVTANAFPYDVPSLKIKDDYYSTVERLSDSGLDTAIFFTRTSDYNIFKISPSRVQNLYRIIFPTINSVPVNFLADSIFQGKRIKLYKANPEWIYDVTNVMKAGNNLLFYISKLHPVNLIYNLKSGASIDVDHILTDSSTYFLPVNKGKYYHTFPLTACDGEFVYTSFSSAVMFDAHEENKDKNIKYNTILSDYFTQRNKTDNPVILQFKLKEKL
ncbi:6-bladed beta-propeller [Pedobacter foliorum]|uniref:6-bladed beta-propeller n=1 Tax=Pedobacter foliorum TaxID=2739058 RepID=UPI0015651066|nr:6-bladed beta-propeller [Pedobacter foliorum]NRF40944.1 6-bladed beta-propeller [Pedobacter foliorum]